MPKLNAHQVKEANELIEKISKVIKPGAEIGAQSKPVLTLLLTANKVKKKVIFFKSRREYSDEVVSHFVNEKGVARSRFHTDSKETIFLLQ